MKAEAQALAWLGGPGSRLSETGTSTLTRRACELQACQTSSSVLTATL